MILYLKKFVAKFYYASSGFLHGIFHDHSIALQAFIGVVVIGVCLWLSLSVLEWVIIIAMILLILGVEFINSAIEQLVDFVCPQYDEKAKVIKDYAAAAVLMFSMLAAIVGIYIIGGKL